MTSRKVEYKRNLRWDILIILGALAAIFVPPQWREFQESRFYRDWQGITPFSRVYVFGTVLEPDGIIVNGSLRKERCRFDRLTAYVTTENGLAHRFPVDTTFEDARGVTGSRPVTGRDETWGPWKIWYSGGLGRAVEWEIYAHHVDCPGQPKVQNNLFAQGKWETTRKE